MFQSVQLHSDDIVLSIFIPFSNLTMLHNTMHTPSIPEVEFPKEYFIYSSFLNRTKQKSRCLMTRPDASHYLQRYNRKWCHWYLLYRATWCRTWCRILAMSFVKSTSCYTESIFDLMEIKSSSSSSYFTSLCSSSSSSFSCSTFSFLLLILFHSFLSLYLPPYLHPLPPFFSLSTALPLLPLSPSTPPAVDVKLSQHCEVYCDAIRKIVMVHL